MKYLLCLALLIVPAYGQITTKYDKFKDVTLVAYRDDINVKSKTELKQFKFWAYYNEGGGKRSYFISFDASCRLLCLDDNRRLIFLTETERFEFGNGSYKLDNTKYGLEERLTYAITKDELEAIAASPEIEFQIGKYEGKFSTKQKRDLKEFLAK